MFVTQFLRTCSCLLLALGIVSITGGDVQGAKGKKDKDAKEKTYKITEGQLQSHVMSFADRFVSILVTALREFETHKPSKKSRYEVRALITYSLSNGYIIAAESDPDVALLDMLSMVTLGRIIFEKEGLSRYGKAVEPIIEGFRMAEKDIRKIAAIVLTPDELTNLMRIINRWRKQNPEVTFYPLIRFSNFAGERRKSTLTRAEGPEGLFESVESASETAEEMRLLAERGMYLATRMPQLWGMFGELWLSNILDSPDIKKTLTDLSQLSQGTAGLASIAEKLPDQITKEREATIKQLMGEVFAMLENPDIKKTLTDLSQLSQGTAGLASIAEKLPDQIATEREATIKQLMAEVSAERKAAIADILVEVTKAMDRAESEGEELVDHSIRQAIILILIGLIGYVIATLFIRYVSNKMKASVE